MVHSKDKKTILLIEDDALSRLSLKHRLESYGTVFEASNSKSAFDILKKITPEIAFVDLDLEEPLVGLKILRELISKGVYSVVLSGREDDEIISQAYVTGCKDYLSKPFQKSSIESIIQKFDSTQNDLLKKLQESLHYSPTSNESDIELKEIEEAIFSDLPILLTGETGTGKTFMAKMIHELTGENRPFVHLNCAEISENLIESELFGHEKGSFTGAVKDKKGLLSLANGGVLFLDEVATLSISTQKKLLKAIEEKSFLPVGSEKIINSQFRLITATCENLKEKVENNEFRNDLLFRLEGFNINLKPLRMRSQDINQLINFFLKKNGRKIVLTHEARDEMLKYQWPGNIRELQKVVEILKTKSSGVISREHVLGVLNKTEKMSQNLNFDIDQVKEIGLPLYIEKIEVEILTKIFAENKNKVRKTLSDLKISNNVFYRIMSQAGERKRGANGQG